MKPSTVRKLDVAAKTLVDSFVADAVIGATKPSDMSAALKATKTPTPIEIVKTMIKTDRGRIDSAFRTLGVPVSIGNVLKTSEQFNYLANAVDAGIKRRAWRCPAFEPAYRALFAKPARNNRRGPRVSGGRA